MVQLHQCAVIITHLTGFDLSRPDNIYDAMVGKNIGTIVTEDK